MLPEWTVVGFSGHRKLPDPNAAAEGIHNAFERLAAGNSPLASVSSAASGGDTLYLEEVAGRSLPYMLILPFSKARFRQDFDSADWERVLPLIENATHVEEVAGEESTKEAYMEAGVLTVDRSDVMIVIWNGKPSAGLGGTGDVVAYARELEKPLLIIDPASGRITEERLDRLPPGPKALHADWDDNPRETVTKHFQELDEAAGQHAPMSRFLVLRIILYQLTASAVGLTALVFENHESRSVLHPLSSLVELVLLGMAFVLSLRHRKKHQEWTENRISAEICRSFLATWEMRQRADHSPKLSIPGFGRLCRNLRLIRTFDKSPPVNLESVRDRYLKERVEDQLKYFSRERAKAGMVFRKLKTFAFLSTASATFLSLLSLLLLIVEYKGVTLIPVPATIILKHLSLLLPLVSTALFTLLVTQDYSRRAVRYGEMATMMERAAKQLRLVRTWNGLARVATETEEELLQEVIEWHSFRHFAGEPH